MMMKLREHVYIVLAAARVMTAHYNVLHMLVAVRFLGLAL